MCIRDSIEPIVRGPAASSDNPGNRRRRVREMLFEQLGVTDSNDLFATYSVLWLSLIHI